MAQRIAPPFEKRRVHGPVEFDVARDPDAAVPEDQTEAEGVAGGNGSDGRRGGQQRAQKQVAAEGTGTHAGVEYDHGDAQHRAGHEQARPELRFQQHDHGGPRNVEPSSGPEGILPPAAGPRKAEGPMV